MINAAQECCFTGTARPDNHHDLPTIDRQVNAIQDCQITKMFDHLFGPYHFDAICPLCTHLLFLPSACLPGYHHQCVNPNLSYAQSSSFSPSVRVSLHGRDSGGSRSSSGRSPTTAE